MTECWLKRSVLALVFLCIVLPSGSIYGFNLKIYLSVFITAFLVADGVVLRKIPRSVLVTGIALVMFLMFFVGVALINGIPIESVNSETQAFLSVFATVLPIIYLIERGLLSRERFLRYIVKISIAHCIIKLVVEFLLVSGMMTEAAFRFGIPEIFGADILLLDYGFFFRVNTSGDFILPLAIFVASAFPNGAVGRSWRASSLVLFAFALFLTYSRYLWLYGAIAVVLGYVAARTSAYDVVTISVAVARTTKAVVACAVLLLALSWSGGFDSLSDRFTGSSAISSDDQRAAMFVPLFEGFAQNPFLGMGIGGYVEELIRIERLPWNYELEWLSFAMQFGVLGLSFLLAAATWPLIAYSRMTVVGLSYAILYSLWIGVGLFNSFLLTSAAGVVFATFIVLGKYVNARRGGRYVVG